MAVETRWHKGSRFWLAGTAVMGCMIAFAVSVLVWWPEHGGNAVDRLFTLAMIFIGGAGAKSTVESARK